MMSKNGKPMMPKNGKPIMRISKEKFKENYDMLMRQGKAFIASIRVLEAKEIKPSAKVLFFNISSLSKGEGYCFASNKFLCEKMNIGSSMLEEYLSQLENNHYIIRDTRMTQRGKRRIIDINFEYLLSETEQTEHNSNNNE